MSTTAANRSHGMVWPYVGVVALLPEARSYCRTLLLDHCSLICNCLRSSDIPNELLYCMVSAML